MTEQQKITFSSLFERLDGLMLRDKSRFSRRLHGVKKVKNPDAQQAILQEMAQEIEQAAGRVLLREAARPAIAYPENLPVSQKKTGDSRSRSRSPGGDCGGGNRVGENHPAAKNLYGAGARR